MKCETEILPNFSVLLITVIWCAMCIFDIQLRCSSLKQSILHFAYLNVSVNKKIAAKINESDAFMFYRVLERWHTHPYTYEFLHKKVLEPICCSSSVQCIYLMRKWIDIITSKQPATKYDRMNRVFEHCAFICAQEYKNEKRLCVRVYCVQEMLEQNYSKTLIWSDGGVCFTIKVISLLFWCIRFLVGLVVLFAFECVHCILLRTEHSHIALIPFAIVPEMANGVQPNQWKRGRRGNMEICFHLYIQRCWVYFVFNDQISFACRECAHHVSSDKTMRFSQYLHRINHKFPRPCTRCDYQ